MNFLKRLFSRSTPATESHDSSDAPERVTIDAQDPMDPHGDGTLREGDALYDLLMGGASSVIANRNDDGTWDAELS